MRKLPKKKREIMHVRLLDGDNQICLGMPTITNEEKYMENLIKFLVMKKNKKRLYSRHKIFTCGIRER